MRARPLHTAAALAMFAAAVQAQTPQFAVPVIINPDQSITYQPTPKGDRIPDFSTVGYNYGNSPLPDAPGGYQVPVVVTLSPGSGDQTDRIQTALDFIASRPLVNGFRGALLLKAGRWEIHSVNRITVRASGVVIRGEGDHPLTGTRLYAVGTTNEQNSGNTRNSRLIAFDGNSNTVNTAARTLVDNVYVPAGTSLIPITGHSFTANQRIQVRWPGTVAWQKASLYNHAATADVDPAVTMNRQIVAVTPDSITLDAPITTPLDPAYARGYIVPVTGFGHITNVGISHCYLESTYANDTDENHVWNALDFTEVEDGFVHNCTARYFAYSIAYVNTSTRKITIDRCQVHDSISQIIGGRRYSFVLTGEMGLVSNALGRYGRHTFVINWPNAPGPNVFVDGTSFQSYNESGSHARTWNNGGLWDNISELNASVGLQVKLERPAGNCVAWNCVTATITFENMPLSPNWSLGTTRPGGGAASWRNSASTGSFSYAAPHIGKAEQWSNGTRMAVRSLYEKQLETRLAAARNPHRYQSNLPTRISYAPVIRTPAQLVAPAGSAWSYRLPVSNIVPATRTPNYTVSGLPAGVSVNATNGLISGTLPAVATATNFNLTVTARNIDGTTTNNMTLTVRPTNASKIPVAMSLEVDTQRTISIALITNEPAQLVPMVPATRLLAPMIVRKSYISDMNSSISYTNADVPAPVRAVLPIEGLTSPVDITYNGSTNLPVAPGFYDIVATLADPVYEAAATNRLLITAATNVTVTLSNTNTPTPSSPVTATSTQTNIPPAITYDGSTNFPTAPGFYTAKAVVADPSFFGNRTALISVQRTNATLSWGNLNLPFTGTAQLPSVITSPAGLPAQISVVGRGILPGSYLVAAWINDPNISHTPIGGTMVISDNPANSGGLSVANWMFGGAAGRGPEPGASSAYGRLTGAQLRSLLPDANLYPDTESYPAFAVRVRRDRQGAMLSAQASDNLSFGPGSSQTALLVSTTVLDADFEQQTYAVIPVGGGPAADRAFLRFLVTY